MFKVITVLFLTVFCTISYSKEIRTNAVYIPKAPSWLNRIKIEKVTERLEREMEWTIRRIQVYWYTQQKDFQKTHSFGPTARAFARRKDSSIHLGPKINEKNFKQIFGHEIVHIISFQKYKGAIPQWLEEGMASYLSKKGKIDYKWLASRPFPKDIRKMRHPYKGSREDTIYHYKASQAFTEMLAKKCDLTNLLRLSVERKMETYINTYCEIKDINASFKAWVKEKSTN